MRDNGDGTHRSATIGQFPTQVSSFAEDRSGELYAITDQTGELHHIGFQRTAPRTD
ncbi:hypothetical protein [Streptomyces sp. YU58]|uniref:hypothetical protein n=1 Tax=Streptomyces sp. SX92 TaxID=3158972 RepID=UPI0027B88312|nr:hypothetical protein [Streptomyces coralus]WLW58274.1 hypothetical protein QU709_46050 [Streptomyces coralus]